MKKRIIVIDDEESICLAVRFALSEKYDVYTANSIDEGTKLIENVMPDVALIDLCLRGESGLDALKQVKCIHPHIVVIMITAYATIGSSVEAMKLGAFSYLRKPLNFDELVIYIDQAIEYFNLNEQLQYLRAEDKKHNSYNIISTHPKMLQVFALIEKLKDKDTGVTITGESGTGKELAARALHDRGRRSKERFVVVNCAAIPTEMLEEEFFGHKQGAFTGAVRDKRGKFEIADNGTLFLDEIGDLPLNLQGKLLRVLQEKEFSPIGSNDVRKVDVRVIAATNRDLRKMVREGAFRQDLYYRIMVVEIKMPPLREHREDIPMLTQHFLKLIAADQGRQIPVVTPACMERLMTYAYPGNVRQLSNMLEFAMIHTNRNMIDVGDLPDEIAGEGRAYRGEKDDIDALNAMLAGMPLKDVEKLAIRATLGKNNGKREPTAHDLGISVRGLINKLEEYGLR